jgi:cytochrome P450
MNNPIPGELLLNPSVLDDPYPFYRRLATEPRVWRAGDSDVYVAASYDAVTEACRRPEDFSSHLVFLLYRDERGLPGREWHSRTADEGSRILATADPPTHSEHKRIVSPEFSPKRVALLEAHVVALTHERLANGLACGHIEFMSALANMIPIEIVSELIALKERDVDALFRSAIVQTDILASAITRDELRARLSVSSEIGAWMFRQLQEAVASPGEGILGRLAIAINDGAIDYKIAMAILMTLFAAGGESTSSLIGNAVFMLAFDQALQQRLRVDTGLIPKFIEEALRLESPFRYHMRSVKKSTTLCGTEIPEGATLLLLWGAANRDVRQFDEPDTINFDRPRKHVGFGSGIHTCIGNTLARLEARVVIEALLASTIEFALANGDSARWAPSLAVRRLEALTLHLLPRLGR